MSEARSSEAVKILPLRTRRIDRCANAVASTIMHQRRSVWRPPRDAWKYVQQSITRSTLTKDDGGPFPMDSERAGVTSATHDVGAQLSPSLGVQAILNADVAGRAMLAPGLRLAVGSASPPSADAPFATAIRGVAGRTPLFSVRCTAPRAVLAVLHEVAVNDDLRPALPQGAQRIAWAVS